MLDSPEGVCAGQTLFEYPATSVLLSTTATGKSPTGSCGGGVGDVGFLEVAADERGLALAATEV